MNLLKTYNDSFSLTIDKPKEKILSALRVYIDKSKRNVFADKLFHGEQYSLTDDIFKIIRKQIMFDPFRAVGQITIRLLPQVNSNKTEVVFQTTPFYKNPIYGFLFLLVFYIVLTILGLVISASINTLLIFFVGGTFFSLIFHLWYKWNKNKLRHYSNTFLHNLLD